MLPLSILKSRRTSEGVAEQVTAQLLGMSTDENGHEIDILVESALGTLASHL
jgi:hypothetical protein